MNHISSVRVFILPLLSDFDCCPENLAQSSIDLRICFFPGHCLGSWKSTAPQLSPVFVVVVVFVNIVVVVVLIVFHFNAFEREVTKVTKGLSKGGRRATPTSSSQITRSAMATTFLHKHIKFTVYDALPLTTKRPVECG